MVLAGDRTSASDKLLSVLVGDVWYLQEGEVVEVDEVRVLFSSRSGRTDVGVP